MREIARDVAVFRPAALAIDFLKKHDVGINPPQHGKDRRVSGAALDVPGDYLKILRRRRRSLDASRFADDAMNFALAEPGVG